MAEKYNNENYTMYNEIEKTGKQTLVNSQTDIVFKGIFLKYNNVCFSVCF